MAPSRPKLLLHVGTTKSGTTTLQFALNASRNALLPKGILYPDVDLNPGPSPKHQWLTNLLLAEDVERFGNNVAAVVAQSKSFAASRVVLSTEGLYNHWFDFPARARSSLAALKENFDVLVWVVFREPVSWAMSMYVQAVKNPPFALAPVYSTAEPPEAVIDHPYFATRLRYDRFVRDAEAMFGTGSVLPTQYESGDILDQARSILGVDAETLASAGDKNKALSMVGLDLMRRLNRLQIPWQQREPIASSIIELDRILGATGEPVRPSADVVARIRAMSRESEAYLAERFGIRWR